MNLTTKLLFDPIRKQKTKEGISFLLSHFQFGRQQLFPRNMSTAITDGKQFAVWNQDQILHECDKANYVDCRLNAYPIFEEGNQLAPSIIFIDIDGDPKQKLDKILEQTLKTIKFKLNDYKPTVLWTGNGYHVYIILDTNALELMPKLTELYPEPSRLFLKFAESCLANRRSDFKHSPSFKSCLLRIPGTLNSKNLSQNADTEIKIINEFQGSTPLVASTLLHEFRLHLTDTDLRSKREISKLNKYYPQNRRHTLNQYEWIEKLLVTPISDYRKCTIDLILAPYLIVIKEYLEKNAFEKMYWTEKCNGLRSLSPSPYHFENKTRAAVQNSLQRKIPPITLTNLKLKYPDWFGTLDICDIIG